MSEMIAPVLTRVTLDADRTISDGTIRVLGILVSNATASAVEVVFTNNDGTAILNFAVAAQSSADFVSGWIADNGLLVGTVGDADVVVSVTHSHPGA